MGTTITVLSDYLKEFIPALKTECLIVAVSLILMSICLAEVTMTSGLTGSNSYLMLNLGIIAPGLIAGLALMIAALVMKPVSRY